MPNLTSLIITPENVDDFKLVFATIHKSSFSKLHFTSSFPVHVLAEYYKILILYSEYTLIAFSDDNPAGFFVSGSNISSGVSQFVSLNRLWLLRHLISHPRFILFKIADLLRKSVNREFSSSYNYRLFSIAVSSRFLRKGVGSFLLNRLEAYLAESRIFSYGLSVKRDNSLAYSFYLSRTFYIEHSTSVSYYLYKTLT